MKPIHKPTQEVQYCTQTSWHSNLPTCLPIAIGITKLPTLASCIILLLFLINANAYAGNYTWNGATSTNWSTSSNWSPAGVPSTNDTVTLSNGGVNSILLDGNRTITRLVISANTINLNTYELHVSGRSSLNGGAINNGNLKIRGTYAYFQGTNFSCTLDVIAGQIKFSGGTFDKTGSFEQNGSASGYGEGGCTFNDDVTIKNTGTVYLRMGQDAGDTFNGKVYLYSSGNYSLQMAYGDTSYFNDTIYVNSTGNGGINFANGTYGASILGDSACLVTGSTGISAGTIQFKNIVQSATSSNSITASGSVLFNVYSNNFLGKVNFTAPNLVVKSTTFGDSTSLTKTGHTLNNTWDGANIYNGVVTITNGNTSTAYVKLASQNADTYNKDVYFNAGTGAIQAANAGTNIYNGNVSVNGNNVTFNTSGGTLKFAGEQNQEFGGGTNTLTFNKLIVDKAGGSVTLNQPITIDSLLELTNGIIYTDTIITLKATATTTGASNMSYVDGAVKKIGNTAFVFPVGDDGHHYPLEISAPSNSNDAFSVIYKNEFHNESDSTDTTLTYISTCQFWDIKRLTGSSNVSVKLYWDSLGCGVFDTTGLAVALWNGTKWVDKGRSSMSGSAYFGYLWSSSAISSFSKVTLGSIKPVFTVTPALNTASERLMPEDIFGYNANNMTASDASGTPLQSWEILFNWDNLSNSKKFFSDKQVTLMRIPAGTLSNFSDWRTNYNLIERDLPFDWFYDKNSYKLPMNRTGNSYDNLKLNLEKVACRPILAMNMLTSTFFFELASFYSLNENNLPLRYIELGNEFYLTDEYYKEIFPSVNDYMDKALLWANDINDITEFQNAEIAVIGAIADDNDYGRKREWLNQVLERLKVTNHVDAITLHDYIKEGGVGLPCTGSLLASAIENFLLNSFLHISEIQNKEFLKIQQFNATYDPKEIWITEYNLDDDNDIRTGTWAHGLLGAALTLKYLETPEVTKIVTHTMLSGGKYGNVFESDDAFAEVSCHGSYSNVTRKAEKSALGTALDAVAFAMRDAIKATPLNFPGADLFIGNLVHADIYGWTFEDANGFVKTIILNLSSNDYNLDLQSIYSSPSSSNLKAVLIWANSNSHVIIGDPNSSSNNFMEELKIKTPTWVTPESVSMNPFSILIIDESLSSANHIRNVRLTDNEICSGSSTTMIIESNESLVGDDPICNSCPFTIDLIENIGDRSVYLIEAGSVTSTQTYPINPCIDCDPISITVHQDLSDLAVSATSLTYCPTTTNPTPITLTAGFVIGNGGDNTLGYSFLWTPSIDSGMVSTPCSNSPMCSTMVVAPDRTTTYGIYVTDGQCWKSAEVEIVVPVHPFTLGVDITVCTNTTINVNPNYSSLDANPSTVATYLWSNNSTSEILQITPSTAGTFEYILTVTDDNCSREDTIIVNVISCCSSAPSVHIKPIEMFIPNSNQIQNEYYNHVGNLATSFSSVNCSLCTVSYTGGPNNRLSAIIDGGAGNPIISIDGEFRIPYDINTDDTNPLELDGMDLILRNLTLSMGENAWINVMSGQRLVLENCTITTCGSNMWRGIVLDKRGDRNSPEIEFNSLSPCFIENAETGVYLTREAIYQIEGVTFNNCYIDIEVVNHKGPAKDNSITGCIFQSSGSGLIAPHFGERKFAGIVLDDVSLINIGSAASGIDPNIFSESLYGIKSKNSSIKLLNNEFHDIWNNESTPTAGMCFYSESDFDFSDRSIQIGNSFTNGLNAFYRSRSGLVGFGEMNYNIIKNEFGINNEDADRLRNHGIGISSNGNKEIIISSENTFRQFNNGILISRPGGKGKILIENNDFIRAFISNNNFIGTAINLFSMHPTKMTDATISTNRIGLVSSASLEHARIGIRLSMLDRVIIENNTINFNLDAIPNENYRGIWTQVCKNIKIQNNNQVINSDLVAGMANSLTGIRMDQSYGSCIEENSLQNLGYGMSFSGNSAVYSLLQNNFNNYNEGIHLESADIGSKQGHEYTYSPGTGNVLENTWVSAEDDEKRVEGTLSNSGIDWYYNGANSVLEFPSSGNLFISTFDLNDPNSISQCPDFEASDIPPINAKIRNDLFGSIVKDTARYEEEYYNQFRYLARQAVYQTLKEFPDLLEMDDDADDDFQEFYQSLINSNINKIDSVETLLSENKLDEVAALLSNFEDTNAIESNYKYVYLAYLNYIANGDSVLSPSDSSILLEIANLNSLTGGKAVFVARNMLNLEIEDELSSSLRMQQIKNSSKNEGLSKLKVFPNPASVSVHIEISNGVIPDRTDFFDLAGRMCFTHVGSGDINVSKLQAGFYLLKAEANGVSYFGNLILKR
ncbi:MAG: hypothetical protein KA347_04885 [Bacteroidia bacterium]|nr:hypothetical protein [Bacteroidia bacterium]